MKSCFAALLCLTAWAGGSSPAQQERVAALEGKLLAPCCYQEPVARHQSEVAVRMRLEIERLVAAGKSESEIISLYVARHGERVLAGYAATPGYAQQIPWALTAAGTIALSWWVWRKTRRSHL
jgi:cytochrome c-type biogenesis protein CcmH/NrfF